MFLGKQKYISFENGNESNEISKTVNKKESKMSSLQHEVLPGELDCGDRTRTGVFCGVVVDKGMKRKLTVSIRWSKTLLHCLQRNPCGVSLLTWYS